MSLGSARAAISRASERIGPYLILNVIGRGGTGIVYRAQHDSSGEVLALKQVLAANVRDIGGVRREIDALRRLHHPGVVRIISQGVDAGIPWYAMELLEGETLASYARRLWKDRDNQTPDTRSALTEQGPRSGTFAGVVDDPPPASSRSGSERPQVACGMLPFVLQITGRLCETLGFMHGEGIVHRDLKSANVLLEKSGMPKLLDFGLAWRFPGGTGREVLDDVSSSIAGTAGYMSPEQIRGEMVDARADLYSLGCVLYELLTGRLPFMGRTAPEVRKYHLDAPVIPPSVLTLGVPQVLDDLVLGLLEKRVEDRPGHASEVARILSSVGGQGAFWDPRIPARSYVYRSPIVGRAEPLQVLREHVSRGLRGEGSLVLISGESGVGKTYLAMAAAREAVNLGMRVVTSTCVPLGAAGGKPGDASLQPFRNLLLGIADRCVASPGLTAELLGARAKVLAACEPHLASLPSIAEYPEPEPLPARAAQERLLLALQETLAAFAAVSPCVCIIDDLQWSDELSLSFLSSLPSNWFRGKGLVIIGVYRADEETDTIHALLRRSDVQRLALGRLAEPSLGDMVRGMLALGSAHADFVDTLVRQSEGNPFFAAEYLRTAVGERLLYRGPSGDWHVDARLLAESAGGRALALPTSIAALIGRRLDRLSAPAQQMLAAAAVLGREIELELLWDLAALAEEAAWEPTRELIARQILEEVEGSRTEGGRTRVRFLHDKLREAAYRRIPAQQRRALHRRAADELERRLHGSPELVRAHATLAYHHKHGERLPRAIEHLELAGEHALESYANRDAVRHFNRAVELDARATDPSARSTPGAKLRRARWHRKLAEAHYALGDLEAVERHIVRGLHYTGYPPPRSKLGWGVSLVRELMQQLVHRTGAGKSWYPKPPGDPEMLVEAALGTHHLAERRYYSFEPLPMLAASLRAVNLGERAGVAVPIATPYAMLGMAAGISQLPALGHRYFELARSAAIRTSDDAGMAYSLYAKAAWRIGDGAWDEVYALCTECLAIARRTRNVKALGMAQTLIGHAAFYTGRLRESVSVYRELEDTARATGDQQHLSWGLYAGARARILLGDLTEARAMLLESSALLEPLVEVPSKIIAPGLLATLYLRSGDLGAALTAADCTSARLRKNLPTVFATVAGYAGAAEVYLARWEDLSRRGANERQLRAARKAARRAVFDLLTFAVSIPLGWPYYHRIKGESQRIAGNRAAAQAAFERGLASARKLGMPYDEALAHLDLARLSKPGSAGREHHLSRAEPMLERLSCRFDLERARSLRAER